MNIRQIYHKESQLPGLTFEPEYNPVRPGDLSYLFMESDVIRRCYLSGFHRGHRFSGVLAPGFVRKFDFLIDAKTDFWANRMTTFDRRQFTEILNNSDADVVSLLQTKPHDPVWIGARFHGEYFRSVFEAALYTMDVSYKAWWCEHPIYFNYFVATEQFWDGFGAWMQAFITTILEDPRMCHWATSNSYYQKRWRLSKEFGIDWWPLMPFLAERLVSVFVMHTNPKIEYL